MRVFLCTQLSGGKKIHRHSIATQKQDNKKATLSGGLII
nr:MAG TPA: hypothetical protein [Caudoviricetes sp.]